jgi:hypothetical protein
VCRLPFPLAKGLAGLSVAGILAAWGGPAFGQAQEELGFSAPSSVVQGAGARAFGMGGAFLARADDATAASWNPAGLSYLARPEFSLVGARKGFYSQTTGADGSVLRTENFWGNTPDFVSAAYPIRIGSASGSVQASFQRVISFEGHRTVDRVTSGSRPQRGETATTPTGTFGYQADADGGFDALSLAAGLRLTHYLRVGLSINRWINGFHEVRVREGGRPGTQEVDFALSGWNINLGIIAHPAENLNLGFVFKSPFTGHVTLDRRRTDQLTDLGAIVVNDYTSDAVRLDFPAAFGLGVSWRPLSPLTVSADYTRSLWSKGRIYNYFTLPASGQPEFSDELYYPTLADPKLGPPQHDTEQWRFGAEYVILGNKVSFPLRAGYFNDRQLIDSFGEQPRLNGFTAGAGVILGSVLFDVAYVDESGSYADPNWGSDTRVHVHIRQLYASLMVRFGAH